MFCTCLSSSPMWLFQSLTHPLFTFGGFSGCFTLSNAQWGGDNEPGDDRDGRGQYPLASVSSMYNLIHNLFSTLNIPQTLYEHDITKRGRSTHRDKCQCKILNLVFSTGQMRDVTPILYDDIVVKVRVGHFRDDYN